MEFLNEYLTSLSRPQDQSRMTILWKGLMRMKEEGVIMFNFQGLGVQGSIPKFPGDWEGSTMEVLNEEMWTKNMRDIGHEISKCTR